MSSASASEKRDDSLSWEDYFMATALLTAQRSKDPATQVGACVVDKENRIVALGYNGFPRNCDDDVFPWGKTDSDPLNRKHLYVVHAEANAILNKNSVDLRGTRIYTALFPCNECAKLIIQSGIEEVIYMSDKYAEKKEFVASRKMFESVGIKCRRFVPQKKKITIDFDEWVEQNESVQSPPRNEHLEKLTNSLF